nr:hypothetical protein [Tanacetum cinerariifolium]
MEILLEPTSNKLMVGRSLRICRTLKDGGEAGNPVKEILLKLNLPDHRSILTDSQVTLTKHERMTKPYSSHRFIANCFNAGFLKMEVKRRSVKVKELQERCIKRLSSHQIKKGMSMLVQSHQCTMWKRSQDGEKRLCLVDDLKAFKITSNTS